RRRFRRLRDRIVDDRLRAPGSPGSNPPPGDHPAMRPFAPAALALLLAAPALAQAPDDAPIQDNSFLVEEAYNQGPGVVQHISTFTSSGGAWVYGFTQEWPLGGMRSQGSYALALAHDSAHGTGPGDVALNYRYQLIGTASAADRLFLAPRVSVLLP